MGDAGEDVEQVPKYLIPFTPSANFEQGGNHYIDLRVCKACGATVMPRHEERHDLWHEHFGSQGRDRCTGLTASWCPVHGACTCPRHGDAENPVTSEGMRGEVIGGLMEDPSCPLHAPGSEHAEGPLSGRDAS